MKKTCLIMKYDKAKFWFPQYKVGSCGLHLNRVLTERLELPVDNKLIIEIIKQGPNR